MTHPRKDQRRRIREMALQILYHWEIARTDVASAADVYFDWQWAEQRPPDPAMRRAATDLAHDTVRRLADADRLIADTAERWRPERMAIIDRLIMRMAVGELLRHAERATGASSESAQAVVDPTEPAAPPAATINEALELARTFSTDESVGFVNGMLDAIRKKLESPA